MEKIPSFETGKCDIANSGLKIGGLRKLDSHLGGENLEYVTGSFVVMALSSSLCPILHRFEPQLQMGFNLSSPSTVFSANRRFLNFSTSLPLSKFLRKAWEEVDRKGGLLLLIYVEGRPRVVEEVQEQQESEIAGIFKNQQSNCQLL